MQLRRVTDPELLRQAEMQSSPMGANPTQGTANLRPVTDPTLLKQLEGGEDNGFNPSYLEKLPSNILTGAAKFGHSLLNLPYNIARELESRKTNSIPAGISNLIPHQPNYDFSGMMELPGTNADKITQSLVQNMPAMAVPEANIGRLGTMIDSIPIAGTTISSAIRNIAPQAGYGAATNENPTEGAKDFGGMQGAVELLKTPFRGMRGLGEFYNPVGYTRQVTNEIVDFYNHARDQQRQAYSYMEPYRDNIISVAPKSLFSKREVKNFTPKVDKLYKEFVNEPTLNNAHRLQSQMFSSMNGIKASDQASLSVRESLTQSRETLQNEIGSLLQALDKRAADQYEVGRGITRDIIAPTQSTPTLRKITRGTLTDLQPSQLVKAIQKGYESGKIPESHYLMQQIPGITSRVNRGEAAKYLIPMGAVTALGAALPGEMGAAAQGLGAVGGLASGAAIAKYLTPGFVNVAQNPWLANALQNNVLPLTQGISRQLAGYKTNQK